MVRRDQRTRQDRGERSRARDVRAAATSPCPPRVDPRMSARALGRRFRRWQVMAVCLAISVAALGLIGWGALGAWQGLTDNPDSVSAASASSVPLTSLHCSGSSPAYSSCSDTSGRVQLSWSAVTGSPGITVQRATSPSGPYSTIATLAGTATGYTDTTAAYNAQYYYEVFSGAPGWASAADVDMALSLPPTGGTDNTAGTGGSAFTAANLTAMSAAGSGGLHHHHPLGRRQCQSAGQQPGQRGDLRQRQPVLGRDPTGHDLGHERRRRHLDRAVGARASSCSPSTSSMPATGGRSGATRRTSTAPSTAAPPGQVSTATPVPRSTGWSSPMPTMVGWWEAEGPSGPAPTAATTWTAQTSGTNQQLNAISCASASQCWAVGNQGVILVDQRRRRRVERAGLRGDRPRSRGGEPHRHLLCQRHPVLGGGRRHRWPSAGAAPSSRPPMAAQPGPSRARARPRT